ncbi:hypothetical protein TMRO357_01713 [Alteriqipengyuania sp. 357]
MLLVIGVFSATILAGIYYETRRGLYALHRIAKALDRSDRKES